MTSINKEKLALNRLKKQRLVEPMIGGCLIIENINGIIKQHYNPNNGNFGNNSHLKKELTVQQLIEKMDKLYLLERDYIVATLKAMRDKHNKLSDYLYPSDDFLELVYKITPNNINDYVLKLKNIGVDIDKTIDRDNLCDYCFDNIFGEFEWCFTTKNRILNIVISYYKFSSSPTLILLPQLLDYQAIGAYKETK